mmetsp:Transcript_32815/g.57222  ORF Transcript_32815/g.57222 Transcript_32815/m.57222 type:complete len:631 (-) Transcript_32815:5055-6947(-)
MMRSHNDFDMPARTTLTGDEPNTNQEVISLLRRGSSVEEISSRMSLDPAAINPILSLTQLNQKVVKELEKLSPLEVVSKSTDTAVPILKNQIHLMLQNEQNRSTFFESLANQIEKYSDPLNRGIMTDPVIAADRKTYQRASIYHYAKESSWSPILGSVSLVNDQGELALENNEHLRTEIVGWIEAIYDYVLEFLRSQQIKVVSPDQIESLCQVLVCYGIEPHREAFKFVLQYAESTPAVLERMLALLSPESKPEKVEQLIDIALTANSEASLILLLHCSLSLDSRKIDKCIDLLVTRNYSSNNPPIIVSTMQLIIAVIKRMKGFAKAHEIVLAIWKNGFKSDQLQRELIDLSMKIEAEGDNLRELWPQLLRVAINKENLVYANKILRALLLNSTSLGEQLLWIANLPTIYQFYEIVGGLLIENRNYILSHSSHKLILLMLEAAFYHGSLPQTLQETKQLLTKERLDQVVQATAEVSLRPDAGQAVLRGLIDCQKDMDQQSLFTSIDDLGKRLTDTIESLHSGIVKHLIDHDLRLTKLESQVTFVNLSRGAVDLSRSLDQISNMQALLVADADTGFNEAMSAIYMQETVASEVAISLETLEESLRKLEAKKSQTSAELNKISLKVDELVGL